MDAPTPQPAQSAEYVRLAKEMLAEEDWFQNLPDSMKDGLSQPNHEHHMAAMGLRLARLIDGQVSE